MLLAHISDLHLRPGRDDDVARALGVFDDAIARGASHILVGGDVTDRANLREASLLAKGLADRGWLTAERLSVVPGNHDAWPYGSSTLARDVLHALVTLRAFHRGARTRAFVKIFERAFDGIERPEGALFPAIKRLGPLALVHLDTSSDDPRAPVRGNFREADARWIEGALRGHEGPRLLLLHHPPCELGWGAHYAAAASPLARRALSRIGVPLEGLSDASLDDVEGARAFIARARFDAVLSGHVHGGLRFSIGAVPVFGGGRRDAYELVRLDGRGARAETVRVAKARGAA